MIRIESIRLRNFRSIREAFFRPLEDGISVIMGSNGAGKTTLLAGMLFALYGVRPPNSTIANLRRQNSANDDECSVSVVFKHLDQDVEVIREIKGSSNRVILNIYVDGVETTVTSVGAGDAWIRQRLGIDAESFMTAFAVRQKELDSLINARPAPRKQIIERLAGIEVINEALKKARKQENDTKATLNSLPGSQTAVEEAEAQVLLLNQKVEEATLAVENVQELLATQQDDETGLERQLGELRSAETALLRDRDAYNNLLDVERSTSEALTRLKYLDKVDETQDIVELRKQHADLTNLINSHQRKLAEANVTRETNLRQNRQLIDDIHTHKTRLKELSTTLERKNSSEVFATQQATEEKIASLFSEATQDIGREKDLRENIALLGHSTDCPTCHTHLENPEALVQQLTELADTLRQGYETKTRELSALKDTSLELQQILSMFEQQDTLTRQLTELEEERKSLLEDLTPEETLADWARDITRWEEERATVTEIGKRLATLEKDKAERNVLTERLRNASARIAELKASLKEAEKVYDPKKVAETTQALEGARNTRHEVNQKWTQVKSDLASYTSRLSIANNAYKSVTEQWKRKKELLVALERDGLTTGLLDKFRTETVASLTPELSENASELIGDITSGAYTQIILDEDFEITVVNKNGDTRTLGELSGGEESAVALALRLAIGLLITGRAPEFLWMDEVLTAQDTDRRASMLETIRGLPYKQIIMVSHTADAGEIADLTVTVVPDLEKGSTLEVSSNMGLDNAIAESGEDFEDIETDFGE